MLAVVEQEVDQGTSMMQMIREKYPEYHPIMAMVDIAHNGQAALELQFQCHKTVAQYIMPTLKSVEVRVNDKKKRMVTVSLFDEEVQEGVLVESNTMDVGMTMIGEVVEADSDRF